MNGNRMRVPIVQYCLSIIYIILITEVVETISLVELDCSQLRVGQYLCPDPNINHIDPKTQQPYDCNRNNVAKVWCIAADGISCSETKNASFKGEIPCQWT